jgi:hypothetical protein
MRLRDSLSDLNVILRIFTSECEFKILRFRIHCGITYVESQDQKINNPGYFEEFSWNLLAGTEKKPQRYQNSSLGRLERDISCI